MGGYLLEELIGEKNNIIIIKRSFSNTQRINHLLNKVKFYDIDKIELKKIFEENKIDVVRHTATSYGRKKEKIIDVVNANLIFPLKLLELCIFFNTDTVLPKNLNYYVMSKKQFLEYGKKITKENNLKFINMKLEHIYGPKDNNSKFIMYLIEKMLEGGKEIDLTEGKQKRDFIYIEDVVDAYSTLLNKLDFLEKGFFDIEVGSGRSIEIKKIVLLIKKICDSKTKLNFGSIKYRENEIMNSCANTIILKKLGWKQKHNLSDGLLKTIKYKKSELINNN